MSRDLGADLLAESTSDHFIFAIFVKMEFDAADINLWNGIGTETVLGDVYNGVGDFGSISKIEESGEISPHNVTLQLSGLDEDLIDEAMNQNYFGRDITIYLHAFSKSTGALLGNPLEIFAGLMSNMARTVGEADTIELLAESELADFDRANNRRFSNIDLQDEYTGDLFFEYLEQLTDIRLVWGNNPVGRGGAPARARRRRGDRQRP